MRVVIFSDIAVKRMHGDCRGTDINRWRGNALTMVDGGSLQCPNGKPGAHFDTFETWCRYGQQEEDDVSAYTEQKLLPHGQRKVG